VDTNNGTEAQNKLLKYKYMPWRKADTLSAFIILLVEKFPPDQHKNYILPNLKAYEWYRQYNDFFCGEDQGQ